MLAEVDGGPHRRLCIQRGTRAQGFREGVHDSGNGDDSIAAATTAATTTATTAAGTTTTTSTSSSSSTTATTTTITANTSTSTTTSSRGSSSTDLTSAVADTYSDVVWDCRRLLAVLRGSSSSSVATLTAARGYGPRPAAEHRAARAVTNAATTRHALRLSSVASWPRHAGADNSRARHQRIADDAPERRFVVVVVACRVSGTIAVTVATVTVAHRH